MKKLLKLLDRLILLMRCGKKSEKIRGSVSIGTISLKRKVRTEMNVSLTVEEHFGPITVDWQTKGHNPAQVEDQKIESSDPTVVELVQTADGLFAESRNPGVATITISADKRLGPDVSVVTLAPINVAVFPAEADETTSGVSIGTVSLKTVPTPETPVPTPETPAPTPA
jgi:hypothetical protein